MWTQLLITAFVFVYLMQPNVRTSISEFISYAHTSVNEVSCCSTLWVIAPPDTFSDVVLWSIVWLKPPGECQVPAEWEALQLHNPKEFPGVYEAVWQPTGEETDRAGPEDGKIREWFTETAVHCITGQIVPTRVTRLTCPIAYIHKYIICFFFSFQVEDLKAKLAVQEVELWQRNSEIEALIAKIGQQTDKLNQERTVADSEEQRVRYENCSLDV